MHIQDPFLFFSYSGNIILCASVSDPRAGDFIVSTPFDLAEKLYARNCDGLWVELFDCNGMYLLDPRKPILNDYTRYVIGESAQDFLTEVAHAMQWLREDEQERFAAKSVEVSPL